MPRYDLHTHTSVSDGKLSPLELIERAQQFDLDCLAITDHDTTDAYGQLTRQSLGKLRLLSGIEFSTYWNKRDIHIIGLDVDLDSELLNNTIASQLAARQRRTENILHKLNRRLNTDIPMSELERISGNGIIGRPHIAEYLVQHKLANDIQHAFDNYLSHKKLGDIRRHWLDLASIVKAIVGSGGIATIAHPAKYKFTHSKLSQLIGEFKQYGGQAMEVVSGKQTEKLTQQLGKLANQHGLYASCGSDFHQPRRYYAELGECGNLPEDCRPVWQLFN